MPTLRPPFPAQEGLWGKPTLINNVETFALVPWIMRHGAEKFAAIGTTGLPADLAEAWKKALVQWRKLEGRPHAPPAEGKEVMNRLNAALLAHGYPDVRL